MTSFAFFRLEHKSFNRADWGYGRVAAHARYGANQNKVGAVATVGIEIGRTSYDTEREVMKLEKLTTRKNGRTGDTIVASFPKEIAPEHRVLMMERFLSKVTFEGRTYAQAWEHTDKPDNPHFHAIVVDKDRLTNESVGKFGHSRSWRTKNGLEPNVTEWMRKQWEDTGNELFGELGYNLQFDRRNFLERGAEQPGIHRGPENDNQPKLAPDQPQIPADQPELELANHIVDAHETVPAEEPISPDTHIDPHTPKADDKGISTVCEDTVDRDLSARIADYFEGLNPGDDFEPTAEQRAEYSRELRESQDAVEASAEEVAEEAQLNSPEATEEPAMGLMADPDTDRPEEADISTAAFAVREIYAASLELNHLGHMKGRLTDTHNRLKFLHTQKDKLIEEKYRHFEEMVQDKGKALGARAHLSTLQKGNGGLKGIRVKLLGVEFATEKRLRAEQAAREERERAFDALRADDMQKQYEEELEMLSAKLRDAQEEAEIITQGPDGDSADLAEREAIIKRTLYRSVQDENLDPKEVWQAWEAGDINEDELRAYCVYSGNKVMLTSLEKSVRQERGQRL